MPNPYFRFKQFTVGQDLCAMKVGTDGVLLGAWANVSNAGSILDVGTGTGLIALMLAQRCRVPVDAIDIDKCAFRQAEFNFKQSPFAERLNVFFSALQDYNPPKHYDLIVSNPPYFSRSLRSPDAGRTLARHDSSLTLEELVAQSVRLLSLKGRIGLILPFDRLDQILAIASEYSLFLARKTIVYPTPASSPKRLLLEFSRLNCAPEEEELVIEKERHIYTEEYKKLTKEYYLMC